MITLNLNSISEKYKIPIIPETPKKYISEGGFGIVYKSSFKGLKIAIKESKVNNAMDEIEKEIRNMVRLRHKNIPNIIGLTNSKVEGGVSIVFELIEGMTIDDYIKKPMISMIEKIIHLIELAKTIDYLHQNNLIHRDLKPENMIISNYSLRFKLLDFGITRRTLNEETKTIIIGTPKYMAPENYIVYFGNGDSKNANSKTTISNKIDIWAIGIIISEVFSEQKAWSKYTKDDPKPLLLKNVNFPVPDNIVDISIRELIMDCTRNSPNKRCNVTYIRSKLLKLLFNSIIIDPKILNRTTYDFTDSQYFCHLNKIYNHLKLYEYLLIKEKIIADKIKFNKNLLFVAQGLNTYITCITQLTRYNKCLFLTAGSDKTIKVWDITSKKREKVKEYKFFTSVISVLIPMPEFKIDRSYFAAGSSDGKIYIISAKEEKAFLELIGHTSKITNILYPREFNKEMLISGSNDMTIRIWKLSDVKTEKLEKNLVLQNCHVKSISFLFYMSVFNFGLSKNFFLSVSEDKTIKSWNISKQSNNPDKNINNYNDTITFILETVENIKDSTVSNKNDGNINLAHFLTSSKEGNIVLWNYSNMSAVHSFNAAHNGPINFLLSLKSYDPDWFASCGNDKLINFYNIRRKIKIKILKGHESAVIKLCYLKDVNEEVIASLSTDGTIKIWNFIKEIVIYNIENKIIKDLPINMIYLENYEIPTLICVNGRNINVSQIK